AAFPNARFVHAVRDPAATCWSNYRHFFSEGSLGYSCDLDDTRSYFALYAALMENWKKLLPGRILDVSYEALTEAPEEEIPRLIEDLELSWDPACLSPEKNTADMRTASAEQVRKPIYKGSSKAWERYAPMIAGRFDGLSELPR
ncbi:MAG: sulfotransferase, partial [Maritimibacter sp.]